MPAKCDPANAKRRQKNPHQFSKSKLVEDHNVSEKRGYLKMHATEAQRLQREEFWGMLLTPVVEKNELEGSLEPSKRSSVSNYRHTHPGQDRQKSKSPKQAGKSHQDRDAQPIKEEQGKERTEYSR